MFSLLEKIRYIKDKKQKLSNIFLNCIQNPPIKSNSPNNDNDIDFIVMEDILW